MLRGVISAISTGFNLSVKSVCVLNSNASPLLPKGELEGMKMEVRNLGSTNISSMSFFPISDETQNVSMTSTINIGCFLGSGADNNLLTKVHQPTAPYYESIGQSSKSVPNELLGGERKCGKLVYDPNYVIGRGSSGVSVHIGYYGATREKVAAKRFNKTFITDVSVIRREVEVMKRANSHLNILQFFGSEMDENFVYIVTELCSGTLEDYVKKNYKGPMFNSEKEILYQMTKGLKHLHDLEIVHRDIKPTNILIYVKDNENTPVMKLADFGLSKALKSDQRFYSNSNVTNPSGTIGWMAPEMYRSDRFDSKADIFPLGCNFYYTLTGGRHPFGDDYIVRLMRIRNKEPAFLEQLTYCYDSRAIDLIDSMLNMEPEDRPTATQILEDDFFEECRVEERTKKEKQSNGKQISRDPQYQYLNLTSETGKSWQNQPSKPLLIKRNLKPENTSSLIIYPEDLSNPWLRKLGSSLIYDPMSVVGYSSFGSMVYRGLFEGTRDVAVKRILRNGDQDLTTKREVELMLRVGDHPNILRYYCCEMDSDFWYIATELCQGNLKDYVEGKCKGPKIDDERDLLVQTTRGLAHLHSLKIIHGDMKPTNCLIFQPEGHVNPLIKLADFGLSKLLKEEEIDASNTSMTNPAGTRGWMAPEQYNSARYGREVDIFALGCIFGYTLSVGGKHPFGDDIDDRIYFVKRGLPMILTNQDLKGRYSGDGISFRLIKSMLNMEPAYRPTALEILNDAFFVKFYAL